MATDDNSGIGGKKNRTERNLSKGDTLAANKPEETKKKGKDK